MQICCMRQDNIHGATMLSCVFMQQVSSCMVGLTDYCREEFAKFRIFSKSAEIGQFSGEIGQFSE